MSDNERQEDENVRKVFFKAVEAGKIAKPRFLKLKSGIKALIAQYTDFTRVNSYSSSIFAQALPPYLSQEEFIKFANYFPDPFTDEVRNMSSPEKHDRALTVEKIFRVTSNNLEVFQCISSAIRASYTDKVHPGEFENSRGGAAIYGISSMGKTYSVNSSLSYFYQVIIHTNPEEAIINAASADIEYLLQVTWLKIICPSKGGPISLCDNIISQVDSLLGTNYSEKFKDSIGNRTELDIKIYINKVKQVIKDINLGILVIDEIQFLAHSDSRQHLADFLVELSDEIGIPIIVIGTLEVITAFNRLSFSFKSKITKRNEVYFEPFRPILGKAPSEYKSLIRLLFKKYQIGKHPINIEDFDKQEQLAASANKSSKITSITDTFYSETGGITQYTINLFILLQQHINYLEDQAQRNAAKSEPKDGKPQPPKPIKTTQQLIINTARKSFKINRDYIDAIITGNTKKLQKMKDVDYRKFRIQEPSKGFKPSVNVNDAQEQYERNIEIPAKLKSTLTVYGVAEKIADQAIKSVMDGYNNEPEFELITKAMELCKKLAEKPDKPVQLSPHIERADINLDTVKNELENIQAFCAEQKKNKDPGKVPALLEKYNLGFNLETELDL